jgi:hypothetical protein
VHPGGLGNEFLRFCDFCDLLERAGQWFRSGLFKPRLVHRRPVKVTQLPTVGIKRLAGLRQAVENLSQSGKIVVAQFGKGAPTAVLRGNRIVLNPVAVDVEKEVVARLHGRIERRAIDPATERVFTRRTHHGVQQKAADANSQHSTDSCRSHRFLASQRICRNRPIHPTWFDPLGTDPWPALGQATMAADRRLKLLRHNSHDRRIFGREWH